MVGDLAISLGVIVALESTGQLGLVQAMWQNSEGEQLIQIRSVLRGQETVLGDAAAADELFVTSEYVTR